MKWIRNELPEEASTMARRLSTKLEAEVVVGNPAGTDRYTDEELKRMGLVGLWKKIPVECDPRPSRSDDGNTDRGLPVNPNICGNLGPFASIKKRIKRPVAKIKTREVTISSNSRKQPISRGSDYGTCSSRVGSPDRCEGGSLGNHDGTSGGSKMGSESSCAGEQQGSSEVSGFHKDSLKFDNGRSKEDQVKVVQYDYSRIELLPDSLDENSVDLVIFDPPYNIGKDYADDDTGDKLSDDRYAALMERAFDACYQVMKPGAVLFYWCNADQGREVWGRGDYHEDINVLWGTPIVWWETFSQYQSKRMTQDFRFIFPFVKGDSPKSFNGEDILIPSERMKLGDKRAAGSSGKVPGRVWKDRRLQGGALARVDWHPLQLPPEQLERVVKGFSNPGDTVLDAFMGSANAGLAAVKHGRKFIGVDKSPTYCRLGLERILAYMQTEVFSERKDSNEKDELAN